jgi:hypothetical protein
MCVAGLTTGSIFMISGTPRFGSRLAVMLCALSFATTCAAATLSNERLTQFLAGLTAAPTEVLPYEEQRMSAVLSVPLQLGGELRVAPNGDIDKRVLQPFQERVVIRAGSLTIEQRGKARTLNLANDRRWREFYAGITGLLNRDAAALQRVFEVTLRESASDWTLHLQPRAAAGKVGLTAIIASGRAAQLTALRIEHGPDEWQEMRFTVAAK